MRNKLAVLLMLALLLAGCSQITEPGTSAPTTLSTTATTVLPTTASTTTTAPTTTPTTVPTTAPTTVVTTVKTTVPTTARSTTKATTVATTKPVYVSTAPITVAPTVVPSVAPEQSSWITDGDKTYYLVDGQKAVGWLDIGTTRYYFDEDGAMHTGWLEENGSCYFFREDGRMGVGKVAVSETQYCYFLKDGKQILVVNPWNYAPENYTVNTVKVTYNRYVADYSYDSYCRMVADCEAATGHKIVVRSAYRSHSDQEYLYQNRIDRFVKQGLPLEEAIIEAGKIVAVPGTSEHELGLAVDLVDYTYQSLDQKQENTPVQKWLMAHCWEYGFILRYPSGTTDATGIVYEPWHYRYVGVEFALELRDAGVCLETYLDQITEK